MPLFGHAGWDRSAWRSVLGHLHTPTLECCEFEEGLPDGFCSTSGDGSDGLMPHPRQGLPDAPKKDITFVLVEGDFQVGLPSGGQTFPCPNWVTGM